MRRWFVNLKISLKLMISYLILCVLMLCVGAMGINRLITVNDDVEEFYTGSIQGVSSIKECYANLISARLSVQRIVLPEYRNEIPALETEIKTTSDNNSKLLKIYEESIVDQEDKAMFQELQKLLAVYRENRQAVVDLAKRGDYDAAKLQYKNENNASALAITSHLIKMNAWNDRAVQSYIKDAENKNSAAITRMTIIIGIALILAIILGYFISRSIVNPIRSLVDTASEVAAGNLSQNIDVKRKDEIGQLENSIKVMVENLRDVIVNVQSSAENVAASSQQLTASADQSAQAANSVARAIMDVAQGAEKQLIIVGEAVQTAEEMSSEAEQIAANANVVASTSDQTAQAAEKGSKAVKTAINQMASIQNTVETLAQEITGLGMRSKEIGQIVETISGIAGQTNLLALNAAIEAARAGEQGRGFAVVAEEVRKLAEQSQEAAKQISSLIGGIQDDTAKAVQAMETGTREVRIGSELVDNAGVAFKEIARLIDHTTVQVKEISISIQQLAKDSQNIVTGAKESDRLCKDTSSQTQSVSAATEEQLASMQEIASASQALSNRAEDLQVIARKFVT